MESWFSNVFFACCALWFKKRYFREWILVPALWCRVAVCQQIFLEFMMYHTRKVQRREVAECVKSLVKELKYGILFCSRLLKCFCTEHCTVYFGLQCLFLVWYVTDSWNICWHRKSAVWTVFSQNSQFCDIQGFKRNPRSATCKKDVWKLALHDFKIDLKIVHF